MKYCYCLIIGFLFCGCVDAAKESGAYPNDARISNVHGMPDDSLTSFFPALIKRDGTWVRVPIDSFHVEWYSSALYAAREPILFNYYQGHDIYRFLWLRSFHKPMIFTLHRQFDKVFLVTKALDRQPNFFDVTYLNFFLTGSSDSLHITAVGSGDSDRKQFSDSLIKADRKADLVFQQTKQLSMTEWVDFERLLNEAAFWDTVPYCDSGVVDGAEWIIEGHLKNRYWYVTRWSPEDGIRKAGEYLILKSGVRTPVY